MFFTFNNTVIAIQVHFSIDSTSLTYEVEDHVDGLFIAKIHVPLWGGVISYNLPQKIHLYRTPDGWKGDHHRSDIIQALGLQIDKAARQEESNDLPVFNAY